MKCNKSSCGCFEIVISIVIAAIIGVLFAFGFIPFITVSLWIVFGLAVLLLILFVAGLYTAALYRRTPLAVCLCCKGKCLLAGIIGTIVLTLVALSINLITTSILVIILISIGAFFATLMLVQFVALLCCIINRICCIRE